MLTPVTSARRAYAGTLRNARLLLAFGLAIMFGSHLTAFSALAQTSDLIVIKNAAGAVTARLTADGYWTLGNAFHPNAGTISLTAGRKYWSVKSATGAVLFAIDCESGEAWSSGPASEGLSTIDPAGSSFSAKNADGTTAFSISPDGAINLIGGIFDWFIQNYMEPAPMTDQLPEDTTEASILASVNTNYGYQLVPAPQAQLRIGASGTDVTCKKWRRRFVPEGTATVAYNLDLGFRYRYNGSVSGINWFDSTPYSYFMGVEPDTEVGYDDNTGTYSIVEFITDYCIDVSNPIEWPDFPSPGMYQFSMSVQDDPDYLIPIYPIGGDGTAQDSLTFHPPTAAFLYDLKFFHPCRIPRKDTDLPVWLGCALWPGNTPGLEAIRLQIYDPNSPSNYREWFVSGSNNWYVVTSWDGYLFENNDSTRPVQVGGNDVVMRAWVTFNTTFDGEPLTPGDYDTDDFVEPRLMIFSPNKAAFESYRFVFNEKNIYLEPEDNPEPGYCEFTVSGTTNFENQTDDPLMQWTLEEMNGSTLTPATASERTGWCVNLRYTNLPPNITDFGFKTLTLTHPTVKPYKVEVQVEIYFPLKGKNFPGADKVLPWYDSAVNKPLIRFERDNSYFYYDQVGQANPNSCFWHYDGSKCSPIKNISRSPFDRYVPFVGPLGNKVYPGTDCDQYHLVFDYTSNGYSVKYSGLGFWGINAFAYASRHEYQHHQDYENWWGANLYNSALDSDSDYMRDNLESGFPPEEGGPYNPAVRSTHPQLDPSSIAPDNADDQAHCMFSMDADWELLGPNNEIDWGYPGSRWNPSQNN